jgi:hypothetical protein
VQAARADAARIHDEVTTEVHRLRSECDAYVQSTLADLENLLNHTLRTIGRSRTPHGVPVSAGSSDYRG